MKAHSEVVSVPSNYSNEELISLIDHSYPELQGPLAELHRRFIKLAGYSAASESLADVQQRLTDIEAIGDKCKCPHCGSVLHVEILKEDK